MEAWLRKYRGYLALALVEFAAIGGLVLVRQPAPTIIEIAEPTPQPTRTPARVVVYVSGAVQKPDVYTLPEGSRLKDALMAAGGPREDADLATLNLALPLQDGQRVHVSAQGETPLPVMATNPPAVATTAAQPLAGGLLDVNSASAADLVTLPGVGPVLAQRIVEDRQANGPYASVEDLARVRGIGPSLIEKLRPLVTVR